MLTNLLTYLQYDTGEEYAPQDDVESYSRNYRSLQVPDQVKKFLVYFRNCINESMIFEVQNLYENTFPKLTEQYFKQESWPDESAIAHIVDNDVVFLILYKELYFRQIYASSQGPTPDQRFGSII